MTEVDFDAFDSFQLDDQILCIQGLTETIIPFTGSYLWKIVAICQNRYCQIFDESVSIKFCPIKIFHYMVMLNIAILHFYKPIDHLLEALRDHFT